MCIKIYALLIIIEILDEIYARTELIVSRVDILTNFTYKLQLYNQSRQRYPGTRVLNVVPLDMPVEY